MTGAESPEYRIAHLEDKLARGDIAEMGIRIEVHGDAVLLSGTVSTAQRRDEILALARAELDGLRVLSDLLVVHYSPPGHEQPEGAA